MEYFEKYYDSEKIKTNRSVDEPILIKGKFTMVEMIVFFLTFIIGVYLYSIGMGNFDSSSIKYLGVFLIVTSFYLTKILKFLREEFPNNYFTHYRWAIGIFKTSGIYSKNNIRIFGP